MVDASATNLIKLTTKKKLKPYVLVINVYEMNIGV